MAARKKSATSPSASSSSSASNAPEQTATSPKTSRKKKGETAVATPVIAATDPTPATAKKRATRQKSPKTEVSPQASETANPANAAASNGVSLRYRALRGNGVAAQKAGDRNGRQQQNRTLVIRNANVHNLKSVSLELPRNQLIVVTGVSGSGKSSLAFDTIYAEGQRRFVESLSSYARQFLARMPKPDVESITGLAPAIAIEQKTISKNPRSLVATTTEVYDFLRVFYARIGTTICKNCNQPVRKDTPRTVQERLRQLPDGARLHVLFPLHAHDKHTLPQEFENLRQKGFFRVTIGESAEIIDLNENPPKNVAKDDLFVLADRLVKRDDPETMTRIADAVQTAFNEGDGRAVVAVLETGEHLRFSTRYECAGCGIRYEEPSPKLFSFNNPFGACPECQGFGRAVGIDMELVFPDPIKTIRQGAISPFTTPKHSEHYNKLLKVAPKAGLRLDVPMSQLTEQEWGMVMDGFDGYIGVNGFFKMVDEQTYKMHYRVFLSRYRGYTTCPKCKGARLRTSAARVFVHGKSIPNLIAMTIQQANDWFAQLQLTQYEQDVADRLLTEIRGRLRLLDDVGLGYLRLDRLSHTLSGGESQRINLATSIGSKLVEAMYVLDEPSIGLHSRDTERLIRIMKSLRDLGNTVIVVEHDPDIIRAADVVVDIGPKAGEHGGTITFQGSVPQLLRAENSLTGAYLTGAKSVDLPKQRRKPGKEQITLRGASEHNLKSIDVTFPLRTLTVVTGVSGSGKSTLVHEILYPALAHLKGDSGKLPKRLAGIDGAQFVGGVEMVDQSPIGRTPRSNPITYVKAFDAIRDLYALTPGARLHGWKPGYFSFNVPGGRCEACQGEGVVKVEMQFLADLYLTCEVCKGRRFNREVLNATWRGKNIVDVLGMTVDEALEFFHGERRVTSRLKGLHDVGLGYIRLGQPATTLSGGEAQRVKLAANLVAPAHDHTLFILDEPTTGLHFDDIATLLRSFNALIDAGHSLIVIEHNLDVIRAADWVIDLGPEAGESGGHVVAEGTPEQVAQSEQSHTGQFLRKVLATGKPKK